MQEDVSQDYFSSVAKSNLHQPTEVILNDVNLYTLGEDKLFSLGPVKHTHTHTE